MKEAHPHPDHTWKIRAGDRLVLGGQLEDLRDLVNRL
jgi:trk system potassium uptake protein TrkA